MRSSFIISIDRREVLRRCAELLDLDPDHVERSGALMRGAVEVQERQISREYPKDPSVLKNYGAGIRSILQWP